MARSRRLRRRPSTPNLGHLHRQTFFTADPASPPETPTASPPFSRKYSLRPRRQPPPSWDDFSPPIANDPSIKPVGTGHQFSYQPTVGPEQLSPRSQSLSSSSDAAADEDHVMVSADAAARKLPKKHQDDDEDEDDDEEDDEDEDDDDALRHAPILERQSASSEADDEDADEEEDDDEDASAIGGSKSKKNAAAAAAAGTPPPDKAPDAAWWEYLIEEMDPADSNINYFEVLYPYEIESAPSRANSRYHLDRTMMRDMKNLNCSNEEDSEDDQDEDDSNSDSDVDGEEEDDDDDNDNDDSDDDDEVDVEMELFYQRQQELRRIRRVSMSSSVGKRTHSELSDSDDDFGPLDVNDVGSSARRLRKRLHRGSLLFHDPPEQIVELDEPDSSEDERKRAVAVDYEFSTGRSLARELPYWTMEIMEIGTS